MSEAAEPWAGVEAMTERVARQVAHETATQLMDHFDQQLKGVAGDSSAHVVNVFEQRVEGVRRESAGRIARIERRQDDLAVQMHHMTGLVAALIESTRTALPGVAPDVPEPGADLPRPPELDAVCAADPAAGLQRIVLDVYGRKVHYMIQPGGDPAELWRELRQSVAREAYKGRFDDTQADDSSR